jgi:hypothetical protein
MFQAMKVTLKNKSKQLKAKMVVHISKPSIWKNGEWESWFEASLGYIMRLKRNKEGKKEEKKERKKKWGREGRKKIRSGNKSVA